MKRKHWMLMASLVLVVVLGSVFTTGAASGAAGTAEDPVVTKSYVNAYVKDAVKNEVTSQMATYTGPAAGSGSGEFTILELTTGQKVIGGSGTEIIVRVGKCTCIGNEENGLADVTQGIDVQNGQPVGYNHLLLCPRDDGRGITVEAAECWVMVRGAYTVQ